MKLSFSINPVALREIRQLVRSKVITVGLAAFPGALFVFTMLAVSAAMNGKSHEELMFGDGIASGPLDMVSVVTVIVASLGIPVFSTIKAILETKRNSSTLEFTTALTPANIVGGRLVATAILMAATIATAMPFFIFSYLLRGIPLSTVFLVPLMIFTFGLSAFAVSLAVACRPGAVPLKIIMTIGLYLFILIFGAAFTFAPIHDDISPAFLATSSCLQLAVVLVFFRAYCAALLSPPHVDGERPFRRVVFALFLLSSPFAFFDYISWSITCTVVAGTLLTMSALSPRAVPRAARGTAPRGFLRRLLSFPFTTGAVPGMLFSLVLIMASCSIFTLRQCLSGEDVEHILQIWTIVAEVTFAPILVGAVLRRRNASEKAYRTAGWTMMALLIGISILSMMAEASDLDESIVRMLPCNFAGITEQPLEHFTSYGFLLLFSVVIIAVSSISEFKKYRPAK